LLEIPNDKSTSERVRPNRTLITAHIMRHELVETLFASRQSNQPMVAMNGECIMPIAHFIYLTFHNSIPCKNILLKS
jgi:hypothetical protein